MTDYSSGNAGSLLQKAAGGDQESFRQLLLPCQSQLTFISVSCCGDLKDARTALRNAVKKMQQQLDEVEDPADFPAFASRITMEEAFQHQASRDYRSILLNKEMNAAYDPSDEEIPADLEMNCSAEDRRNLILQMLKALPEAEKTIFMMHYFGGKSFQEISELLNIPEETIKSAAQSAKDHLCTLTADMQEKDKLDTKGMKPVAFFLWLLKHEAEEDGLSEKEDPQEDLLEEDLEKTISNVIASLPDHVEKDTAEKPLPAEKKPQEKFLDSQLGRIVLAAAIAVVLIAGGRGLSGMGRKENMAAASADTSSDGALEPDKDGRETVACPDGSFGCIYEYTYDAENQPAQRTYMNADGSVIETINLQ